MNTKSKRLSQDEVNVLRSFYLAYMHNKPISEELIGKTAWIIVGILNGKQLPTEKRGKKQTSIEQLALILLLRHEAPERLLDAIIIKENKSSIEDLRELLSIEQRGVEKLITKAKKLMGESSLTPPLANGIQLTQAVLVGQLNASNQSPTTFFRNWLAEEREKKRI